MAKGLKEQQIAIIHIPTDIYNIAHIQACCLAKNANIQSSWIASETHREMSSLLVVVKSHLFPALVHILSI